MVKIKLATEADTEVLALLGRITWDESHGHYIEDKNNLIKYLNENFSIAKTKENINNQKNFFYVMYVDKLPVGYAKLIVNAEQERIDSKNNCRLERIFILDDFIPLKIGHQLLTYVEERARELKLDTMWLTVYIKNIRAIKFYERNQYIHIGELNFSVSGKEYENIILSKKI